MWMVFRNAMANQIVATTNLDEPWKTPKGAGTHAAYMGAHT